MAQNNELYVGNACEVGKGGMKIQLDCTTLWEHLKSEAKDKVKTWTDKTGKEHKSIDLVVWPLKEQNQTKYRTHSVKIDTWEKTNQESKNQSTEMPF